jgi:RNA polymerase sigma factor (sigma-70 family)
LESTTLNEIIKGCKNNDRNSQKLLFEMFAKKMMGVCLRYSSNYETARDMVQDGFIKIFTKISSFKGESAIETWMTRIFINTCLSNLSKAENKNTYLDINDPQVQFQSDQVSIVAEEEESLLKTLSVESIHQFINQLPEKYKIVLNMYSIDGYSHQQIANELNIEVGSSKSRLSRARIMLMEIIKKGKG